MARLVRSVDFERALRTRSRASTAHFALHHVSTPASAPVAGSSTAHTELSTDGAHGCSPPVDDSPGSAFSATAAIASGPTHWLGAVVPKRHARRAVTRTLLKRQIRAAAERHGSGLPPGLWVVRLRAPFDRKTFVSAASDALRLTARHELDLAFVAAAAPQPRPLREPAAP